MSIGPGPLVRTINSLFPMFPPSHCQTFCRIGILLSDHKTPKNLDRHVALAAHLPHRWCQHLSENDGSFGNTLQLRLHLLASMFTKCKSRLREYNLYLRCVNHMHDAIRFALDFVDSLAFSRAREAPPVLRRSVRLGWRRRWGRMLAVSCARAFAASLVALPAAALPGTDGATPDLADLFL